MIARPIDTVQHWLRYTYSTVANNVNMLNIIQLGLTFYNECGTKPFIGGSTWQFNFKFSLNDDMFAPDSIQLLIESGFNFSKFSKYGISHKKFAEKITMSGLFFNSNIKWICFHGSYDFAYLLKMLTNEYLPLNEVEFFEKLSLFFPFVYDLKVLLRDIRGIKGGGLQKLANALKVTREGTNHQAGSDSLLTGDVFFKMRDSYFEDLLDENKYANTIYGLGKSLYAKKYQKKHYY